MTSDAVSGPPRPTVEPIPREPRVDGVDAARGLALVGMFVAHVAPPAVTAELAALIAVADERPRLLFALTAGLGLGFMSGGTRPLPRGPGGGRGVLRRQIAIRAIILIVLGLIIAGTLHPLVFIILDVYGVAFLVLLPLMFLRRAVLIGLGAGLLLVAPGVAVLLSASTWVAGLRGTAWRLPLDWFISGAYPVIEWVPVMMIGLGIARFGATRPRVVASTAAVGAVAAIALLGPATRILDAANATRADIAFADPADRAAMADASLWGSAVGESLLAVANVGVGAVVVAAAVWLTALAWPRVRRVAGVILSPFTAMGAMPLTIYTAHLVIIAAAIRTERGVLTDDSWALLAGLVVGSMVFALLWRRFIGRGPLEQLLRLASGRARAPARTD